VFDGELVEPAVAELDDGYVVRMPGIGGTGVVTTAQILALAASLDGLSVHGLDQTGLSQKAGPVVSDLVITTADAPRPGRATAGDVDLLLVFDAHVAVAPEHLASVNAERSVLVGSRSTTPTGRMVLDRQAQRFEPELAERALGEAVRASHWIDANALAMEHLGSTTTANLILVGVAYQNGLLPIRSESIEAAIDQNGTAVTANIKAFRLGRHVVQGDVPADSTGTRAGRPETALGSGLAQRVDALPSDAGLRRLAAHRAADLAEYQNTRYAARYLDVLARVSDRIDVAELEIVATYLHKLMAYKDEYEVARLHLAADAQSVFESVGGAKARVTVLLHPPILRALGLRRKLRFGPWARPLLRALRAGRVLRGTPFDIFGYAKLRRVERRLVGEYVAVVDLVREQHDSLPAPTVIELLALPDLIRGYEEIKLASVERFRSRLQELVAVDQEPSN
jgi:indolepyruvate ferredoxin oxidoreductase